VSRTLRIFLTGSIALAVIPVACHQQPPAQRQPPVKKQPPVQKQPPAQKQPPVQKPPEVPREVKDTTTVTGPRDASVLIFFRDTAPSGVQSARVRTFDLRRTEERQDFRTTIRKQRGLWRSRKPGAYRYLLRVGCFCPGARGWQLMEVRSGQPLRAWDRTGRSVPLTDWNTVSIDRLYENLEQSVDRDRQVQIAFDPRWHFPTYIRTTAMLGPDTWSNIEARALRRLR
jgi:hypothetical protein